MFSTEFWAYCLNILKRQGVIVVFLCIATGYFYQDNQKIKKELDECQQMYNSLQAQIIQGYQYRFNTEYKY